MDDQHGRVLWGGGLPMAFCEKADLGGDLKDTVLCGHPGWKTSAGPPSREEGHAVRAI